MASLSSGSMRVMFYADGDMPQTVLHVTPAEASEFVQWALLNGVFDPAMKTTLQAYAEARRKCTRKSGCGPVDIAMNCEKWKTAARPTNTTSEQSASTRQTRWIT